MSSEQLHEIEHIAEMLVQAREVLEKLQLSGYLPEINPLHAAISYAHWLCHRVYDGAHESAETTFRNVLQKSSGSAASV